MSSDWLDEIKIFVYIPTGNQASKNHFSICCAHIGTFDACLYTCVFHAIILGTAARSTWLYGKFHGATQ